MILHNTNGVKFCIQDAVRTAAEKIRSHVRETPLEHSSALSQLTGCHVYLKCENLQYTGAFKIRGAMNKLLNLTPAQCMQGVVTASSGNHGAAVACGLNKLNIRGTVFVPENASPAKIANIRRYNVPVEFYATDCMQTELHALDYAQQHKMVYISPYNDWDVVAGQGTIALELMHQLEKIDVVLVPVGGGGLISGIASYLKSVAPSIKIIGCLPENSPVMAESIKAGRIIEMETKPTLSDATAGGIEAGSITFDICQQTVDDYILVSEAEIKNAMDILIEKQNIKIEGAAGVAVAALLKNTEKFHGKNVVVILSGANITT